MTESKETIEAQTTLLGLGPPEPPDNPLEVALEKTDARDARVETMRAWSASRSEYEALTRGGPGDEWNETPLFGARHARRRRVLAVLGGLALATATAVPFAMRARRAPQPAPHSASRPAPKVTVLVGGPWVLRPVQDVSDETSNEAPAYLYRTPAPSTARSAPSTAAAHAPDATALRARANATRAPVISDAIAGSAEGDPDRIQTVADAVHLEDEDDAPESTGSDR